MGDPDKTQLVPGGEGCDPGDDIPTVLMMAVVNRPSNEVARRVEGVGLPEETTEPGTSTEPVAGRVPVIAPAASFDLPVIGPPKLPAVPLVSLPPVPSLELPAVPPVSPPPISEL